ncbi:syntaxin-16-like isoform X2 [Rhopalosiphum padi]|uniref:syntaxin-16-like isoform X2 n=1 Tax=Rhopalosiphum padi TaxID=40932 RepID=UPI00298E17FA|nr:syntaxin-16-like isoform X2 [Rhopalosiphum padi]
MYSRETPSSYQLANMTTRSFTNIYMLMRKNCMHTIHSFKESTKHNDYDTDSEGCVNDEVSLMEAGRAIDMRSQEICPPPWTGLFEDAQCSIAWLQNKLEELRSLQDAHLLRPTALNDSNLQEKYIQNLTLEITRIFASTKKTINQIQLHSNGIFDNKESQLSYNVSSALMSSLQNVFNEFRNSQKVYRNKIKNLEGISLQMLFETNDNSSNSNSLLSINEQCSSNAFGQQLQMLQSNQTRTFAAILIEEENAKMAVQLEREANQIASSIVELNNIFKDVAHMAVQQGNVLDRIDYNIEQAEIKVKQDAAKLIESEDCYDRKIKCILILVTISFVLLILLEITTF